MTKEQKIPLKKIILIGVVFVLIVTATTTFMDIVLWNKEFSIGKYLFEIVFFGILYALFHKFMIKK